jgi:hypothetical protein
MVLLDEYVSIKKRANAYKYEKKFNLARLNIINKIKKKMKIDR